MVIHRSGNMFEKAGYKRSSSNSKSADRQIIYGRPQIFRNIIQVPHRNMDTDEDMANQSNQTYAQQELDDSKSMAAKVDTGEQYGNDGLKLEKDDIDNMMTTSDIYGIYLPYAREKYLYTALQGLQLNYIDPILTEDNRLKFTPDDIERLDTYLFRAIEEIIRYHVQLIKGLSNTSNINKANIINDIMASAIRETMLDFVIKIAKEIHISRNYSYINQKFEKRDFSILGINIETEDLIRQIEEIATYETDRDQSNYKLFEQNNSDMKLLTNLLLNRTINLTENCMEVWNNMQTQNDV